MNEQEFWSNMKRDDNGCLIWQRFTNDNGYGRVKFNGKGNYTHRVAWELKNGTIPNGYDIHHRPTCNHACCEVSHMTLLTRSEHMVLTNKIGQVWHRSTRGESSHLAKLTNEQVRQIAELHKNGLSQHKIATMFGVNQGHISKIIHGKRRKYG